MKLIRLISRMAIVMLLPVLAGCDFLLGLLPTMGTTVELVNNSDFDVDVVLFYDDTQEIPELLLVESGTRVAVTVAPGATHTFARPCDDLQAIVIDDADLRVVGEIGPEANSDVLRDGDDFSCGSTIRFTFDHSAAILDFDVTTSVSGG